MKVPFRAAWGSSGSRCGETSSSRNGAPPMRSKKEGKVLVGGAPLRFVQARTKDSLDTTKESSESLYEEPSSTPVDVDQFCKEEEGASNTSDAAAVVGGAGILDEDDEPEERLAMDSVSHFGALAREEKAAFEAPVTPLHNNNRRMSALTKAMAKKQGNLTNAMQGLFDDAVAFVVQHHEGRHDTPAGHDEDEPMQISQLKERVAENLKKQGRVTKQFIDLIGHLEDEAMKKEAINLELQKRLKLANQLLEAEGIDAVESCVVPSTGLTHWRRSTSSRSERLYQSGTTMPQCTPPAPPGIMFAITEIFCDHNVQDELDDVTCLLSETAHVAPEVQQHEPTKKSHSSVTDKTVPTDDSIQVAVLQSEKELLEF